MPAFVGDEPGNIEKRRADRVDANFTVTFRELEDSEAERLADLKEAPPAGEGTPGLGTPELGVTRALGHTENISQGGLSLTGDLQLLGDRKLERGKKLLVEFMLPGESQPVSAVAVVVWNIEGRGEHGKFTAGLMFTAVDNKDLEKIQRYVEEQPKLDQA